MQKVQSIENVGEVDFSSVRILASKFVKLICRRFDCLGQIVFFLSLIYGPGIAVVKGKLKCLKIKMINPS